MKQDSRIYLAGHRGMVGGAILRNLRESGYTNIIVQTHDELDLTDGAAVEAFFANEKPEFVFLAAAKVGGILALVSWLELHLPKTRRTTDPRRKPADWRVRADKSALCCCKNSGQSDV